ncbi:peptidylprolyl isomerase [Paenibacillus pasadenensis]|uniref:peptidylprolyl isomerase n=1 Tax=Paenibacillus pasadenensis TaxID=217090 RepID=UPI00203EA524|nr:peptidylprolyl isomerase [Paenibacillus pasadenensis]
MVAAGILLCLTIMITLYNSTLFKESNSKATVVTINNTPIGTEEFQLFLDQQRSDTVGYFKEKYGAVDSPDFWTTAFGDEVPIEKAKQLALDALTSVKIQQLLAKQEGLVQELDYPAFLQQLAKENKRRETAVQQKKVIYGPVQYDAWSYYNYLFSNLVNDLKSKLKAQDEAASDETLREFYNRIKDPLYREKKEITVEQLYISNNDGQGWDSAEAKQSAFDKLQEAAASVRKGASFAEAAAHDGGTFEFQLKEQRFDQRSSKQDAELSKALRDWAMQAKKGQVSEPIEAADGMYVLRLLTTKGGDFQTFEHVKEELKIRYAEDRYQRRIQILRSEAHVVVNTKHYQSIK